MTGPKDLKNYKTKPAQVNSKLVIIKFWKKTLKHIEILIQIIFKLETVCKSKIDKDFLSKALPKKYAATHNLWPLNIVKCNAVIIWNRIT